MASLAPGFQILKYQLREKTNSWERTEGQAGCGREKLQGYACKVLEPTEWASKGGVYPRVVMGQPDLNQYSVHFP